MQIDFQGAKLRHRRAKAPAPAPAPPPPPPPPPPAPIFFDALGYPAGTLTGQGPWGVQPSFPDHAWDTTGPPAAAARSELRVNGGNLAAGVLAAADLDGDFTITLDADFKWFIGEVNDFFILIGDLGGDFIGLALHEWEPEPKLFFEVFANGGGTSAPFDIAVSNAWAMKFTRAGTVYSVYLDGVLKAQMTAGIGPTPANADLSILYQHEDSDPANDGRWTIRNLAYYDGLTA